MLTQKAASLEQVSSKVRSDQVKAAIEEVLGVVSALQASREEVHKAFNTVSQKIPRVGQSLKGKEVRFECKSVATQTKKSECREAVVQTDPHPCMKNATTDALGEGCEAPGNLLSSDTKTGKTKQKPNNQKKQRQKQQQLKPQQQQREPQPRRQEKQLQQQQQQQQQRQSQWSEVVRRKRSRKPDPLPEANEVKEVIKRRRPPKTQAVVLGKPPKMSYADMVKEVKETVRDEAFTFDIAPRRTKSGNLILEIKDKIHADTLAIALKRRFGEEREVRRPSPSVALIVIGIEDSVDEGELMSTLEAHDPELKVSNTITIREGPNGVRTAVIRVPVSPGLKLARLKKLKVGWSKCRIKELAAKSGCARCSAPDHVARECVGEELRRCFRCKMVGHLIASCKPPNRDPEPETLDRSKSAEVPAMSQPSPSCL